MSSVASIIPRSLSRELTIYKLGLRIKRYGSRRLSGLADEIEKSLDSAKMQQLWQEVGEEYHRDPACAAKYAKPRQWLRLNALRAGDLGLHRSTGLRILDIGCGPGYFLAVSRALGHQTEGVDAPESYMTPVERRVYTGLIDVLRCSPFVRPLLVERYVPLPFSEKRYDLITAFWICFNRHRQPDEWGSAEWKYFVEDAISRLTPGGRLFLDLNENPERYGDLRFYDAPTFDYFRSVGAVDQGRVVVTRGERS